MPKPNRYQEAFTVLAEGQASHDSALSLLKRIADEAAALVASAEPKRAEPVLSDVLPSLGEEWTGLAKSIFGGLSFNAAGEAYALVVLGDRPPKDRSQDGQLTWAKGLDADLPSPAESALLVERIKAKLPQQWCWTNKREGSSCAWLCNFGNGTVYYYNRSSEGGAVAVRRLPINPSILRSVKA